MNRIFAVLAALLLAGCASHTPLPTPSTSVPLPPAPPRAEPPGFLGLSQNDLRTRLGAPVFTRKDGPTEMWRYDTAACRAFFFFDAGKVAHVETLPENAATACLSALKKVS